MQEAFYNFCLKNIGTNSRNWNSPTAPSKNIKITINHQEEEEQEKKCC